MIFVGVDWAEDHHDICVMVEDGKVLGKRRVPDSVSGIGELHDLVGEHAGEEEQVVVGIEIDRGLIVTALLGAGYEVFAINPLASSRYRDRHATSGAKSDTGDAKVLADLVRTDRHNHRPVSGDSELVEGLKVLARSHQSAIWSRQRQVNALRSALSRNDSLAPSDANVSIGCRSSTSVISKQCSPNTSLTTTSIARTDHSINAHRSNRTSRGH